MQIQLTKNVAGPTFSGQAGQVADVATTLGNALVAAGSATSLTAAQFANLAGWPANLDQANVFRGTKAPSSMTV